MLGRTARIGFALLASPAVSAAPGSADRPVSSERAKSSGPAAPSAQADLDRARKIAEDSRKYLQKQEGIELFCPDEPVTSTDDASRAASLFRRSEVDALVIQHGAISHPDLSAELIRDLSVPIAVWGIPEPPFDGGPVTCGSMAGLLAHTAALTGMGRRFTFVYGLPDSEEARKQLDRFIRTILVRRALRWAKIALVGCDSPGSFAGASDRLGIKNLFGSEIQHVALSTLLEQIRTLTDKEIEEDVRELRSADYVVEVSDLHAVRRSCTAYSAVKKILVQGGFAAAAIKCRPELIDVHKLGMYAVCSQLTDSGMPANCDGDVDAALTMLIQHAYTGRPPFCANWIQRDDKTNQVLFWSGGSAPASLINPKFQPRITDGSPVRENVAFDFPLKTGDVTAARLCWHAGRCKLLVARGRAVEPPAPVKGTHVSIRFEAPVQALLGAILKHGFPQGYCIVYEDIKDEMIELADQLGIEAISPEPGEL